jgi:hypothetical protein
MKLYFDTNIYDFIEKRGDPASVRQFLDRQDHVVEASGTNLVEVWRIPQYAARARQVRTIATVARAYEQFPGSFLEAREVLDELRRVKPQWVRRFITREDRRRVNQFLTGQRELWREIIPSPSDYAAIVAEAAAGSVAKASAIQAQPVRRWTWAGLASRSSRMAVTAAALSSRVA